MYARTLWYRYHVSQIHTEYRYASHTVHHSFLKYGKQCLFETLFNLPLILFGSQKPTVNLLPTVTTTKQACKNVEECRLEYFQPNLNITEIDGKKNDYNSDDVSFAMP